MAESMMSALEQNVDEFGVRFLNWESGRQGIVHVIGPELGLSQPGMTIACGDSPHQHPRGGGLPWVRNRDDRGRFCSRNADNCS